MAYQHQPALITGNPTTNSLVKKVLHSIKTNYALSLFLAICAIPTTASILHYGLISADRYVSETKFIVRGVSGSQVGGLTMILKTFGFSAADDDANAINAFINSRDALKQLMKAVDIRAIYQRPEADFITSYGGPFSSENYENLYEYYRAQVSARRDIETGMTTLRVSAYRPDDAYAISQELLRLSETKINEMNARARRDTISTALDIVGAMEKRVVDSQVALTAFRNEAMLVDPTDAASGNLEIVAALSQRLAETEVKLRKTTDLTPNNPTIAALSQQISALSSQIKLEQGKLTGDGDALASKLSKYEGLVLQRTLAEKAYEKAVSALDNAQEEARRKQIYLEPIAMPYLSDRAEEPRRTRYILTTALLSFASYVMAYLLISGSREHLNFH